MIGRINLPLVTEGEALFHITRVGPGEEACADAVTMLIPALDQACGAVAPEASPSSNRSRPVKLTS